MQSRKSILMNLQLCNTIDFFQLQQVLSTYIIQIGVYLRIRGVGIFVGESIGFHPNVHRCLSSISIGNMSRFWSINWWSNGRSGSLMVCASWPAKRRIRQQLLTAISLPPPREPSVYMKTAIRLKQNILIDLAIVIGEEVSELSFRMTFSFSHTSILSPCQSVSCHLKAT